MNKHQKNLTALLIISALNLTFTPHVWAQNTPPKSQQVRSGTLVQAINQLSQDNHRIITYDPTLLKGLTTSGLSGHYTFEESLQRLLADQPIVWEYSNGSYSLRAGKPLSGSPSAHAAAQKVAQNQLGQDQSALEDIVVIGRPQSKHDAVYQRSGGSVYLNEADLNRFARISAADMFKGVAGVESGDSRNGGALDVNIRGIQGMGRVAVTVDGSQQALESYRGYAGTQTRSYIPTDLISSVNIEKGPSTQVAGTGAIGGMVQLKTIGVQDVLKKDAHTGLRITGNLGSNSTRPDLSGKGQNMTSTGSMPGGLNSLPARSGSIAFAHKGEYIDLVAAYAKHDQGNYYSGKKGSDRYAQLNNVYRPGEEIMNTSSKNETTLLKASIRPTDEQTLDLSYRYFDGQFGEIMGSSLYRGNGQKIPQWPVGSMRINAYTANYHYLPSDNPWLDLKANVWLTNAKNHQLNGGPVGPESQQSEIGADYNWSSLKNRRGGFDFSNNATFNTSWGDFVWTVGGAYLEEDISPNATITEDDKKINRGLRDAKRKEMSVLTQLQYMPNDKWTFEVGGRYSKFKNQDRNQRANQRTIYENNPYKRAWLDLKTPYGYTRYGMLEWFADDNGEYLPENNPQLKIKNGDTKDLMVVAYGGPYKYDDFLKMMQVEEVRDVQIEKEEVPGIISGYEYTYNPPMKYSGHEFAPFASIRYQATPNSHLYARYTEAVRMPGLFETTMGMGAGVGSTVSNLKAERSKNWEIGAAAYKDNLFNVHDQANVRVAYFKNDIHDFIARYYKDGLEISNSDSYKVSGMEMQLNYDTGRFFVDLSATKYFKAQTCDKAMATYLSTDIAGVPNCTDGGFSGSYVNTQNPPKTTFVLTAGTRLMNEKLELGTRITKTSGPLTELTEPWQAQVTAIQLKYEPVTVVDLFANYNVNDVMSFNFSIDNISNRYYLDPLAQTLSPAPGRNYKLGFKYHF